MKWIKANNGIYYNLNDIITIEWRKNGSAIGASFDLKCENKIGIHVLATCNSEADKQVVADKLEDFLTNDERFLILPKF